MKKAKLVALGLVSALVVGMFGCGGKGTENPSTESSTAILILSFILSGILAEDFFTSSIQTESRVEGTST